jgi:hypothetical protein
MRYESASPLPNPQVGEGTNSGVFGPVSGAKISGAPRYIVSVQPPHIDDPDVPWQPPQTLQSSAPNSATARATSYTLKRWPALKRYADNGQRRQHPVFTLHRQTQRLRPRSLGLNLKIPWINCPLA